MDRYLVDDLARACALLDDNDIRYDFDGADRLMINSDYSICAENLFEAENIRFALL